MAKRRWMHWLVTVAVSCTVVCGSSLAVLAGNPLGGAALESGCRDFAGKAAKYGKEWEQRDCLNKLKVGPQELDSDYNTHLRRCYSSVGTSIDRDMESIESYIKKCRGSSVTAGTGVATGPSGTGASTGTTAGPGWFPPPQEPHGGSQLPGGFSSYSTSDVWDLVLTNSFDMARSYHRYRLPGINGNFVAENLQPDGMSFSGNFSGSVFRAFGSDRSGYQANFYGRMVTPDRVEGTGCDNRSNGYSFTLIRR